MDSMNMSHLSARLKPICGLLSLLASIGVLERFVGLAGESWRQPRNGLNVACLFLPPGLGSGGGGCWLKTGKLSLVAQGTYELLSDSTYEPGIGT